MLSIVLNVVLFVAAYNISSVLTDNLDSKRKKQCCVAASWFPYLKRVGVGKASLWNFMQQYSMYY